MCGIAGYISKHEACDERISDTLDLMRNRGPDNRDFARFNASGLHVGLLHTRLSILDLDARSNQPFSADGCTIVFNGEIYNYLELRAALEQKGHTFHTRSDTEVLLRSYLAHGEDCVTELEGMWSFAIYDRRSEKVFLSRDRFAEKPLYYYENADGMYFGSEVKFIKALSGDSLSVNARHLLRYMVNGYKSLQKTDETYFDNIRELPFATNMTIDSSLQIEQRRYWVPPDRVEEMRIEDAIAGFRERLIRSVELRLRSDVPLAFCLSGGVDSAGLVSIASKVFDYDVATFSIIDSDERYNEQSNIQATVDDLGCQSTLIETSRDGFFDRLEGLVKYHDAPLCTLSYYIHSFLSEEIARQGYKVVFSGTGADEMVTGYYDHFNLFLHEMRHSPNYARYVREWQAHTGRFVRNPYLQNPALYGDDPNFRGHIYLGNDVFAGYMKTEFSEPFTEARYSSRLLQNRMMNEMFHEGTRVILNEDDLNSMMYSIENRSPYLDTELFDFATRIPTEHLIQDGYGKYILRMALDGVLNDSVRLDRKKKGFNASINSLVDFSDADTRDRILADGPVYDLVDRKKIEDIISAETLPNSVSKFWFNFLNVQLFLETA